MVIGTKELGGLLFQGEKIKIEKNWEVVGWVLGQVILKKRTSNAFRCLSSSNISLFKVNGESVDHLFLHCPVAKDL